MLSRGVYPKIVAERLGHSTPMLTPTVCFSDETTRATRPNVAACAVGARKLREAHPPDE
jgi:hypothetical protein